MNNKNHKIYYHLGLFLFCAMFLIPVIWHGKIFSYSLFESDLEKSNPDINDVKEIFPDTYKIIEKDNYFEVINNHNGSIGKILYNKTLKTEFFGYGGKVPILIGLSNFNKIITIKLIDHNETPRFVKYLKEEKFIASWNGYQADSARNISIDALSGATLTCNAIENSMQASLNVYLKTPDNITKKKKYITKQLVLFVFTFLAVILFFIKPKHNDFLNFHRILIIIIPGFWLGSMLSISMLNNITINGIDLKYHFGLAFLLIVSFILPLINKRNFYCTYFCPMGACQDIAIQTTKKTISIPHKISKWLIYIKYIVLTTVIFVLITQFSIDLTMLEPFPFFALKAASLFSIIYAVIFIFLSLFFSRPFCNYICPTGLFLEIFRKPQKLFAQAIRNNKKYMKYLLFVTSVFFIIITILVVKYKIVEREFNHLSELSENTESFDMNNNADIVSLIRNRKSVRSYTGEKITDEQIQIILQAGMAAPSAVNAQPWAFVVVTQRETLDNLGQKLPYAKMLKEAGAAIIVCGDMKKALPDNDKEFWVQDCSAASQNILLAIESLGLGAVWTAVYPNTDRIKTVKSTLALPDNVIPLNVIPVGVPKGMSFPKDKWNPANIHWEKW